MKSVRSQQAESANLSVAESSFAVADSAGASRDWFASRAKREYEQAEKLDCVPAQEKNG